MLAVLFAVSLAAAPATIYLEAEPSSGGAISGRITYDGSPPKPSKLNVSVDRKFCGATHDDDSWMIGADRAVKNVVVYLSDIKSGKKMSVPKTLTLNQVGCRYVPRFSVVAQGSALQISSSDPVLHNVRSYQEGTTLFNVAVPPLQSFVVSKKLDKPGGIKLRCDVHNFMRAAIFVVSNPYYAVTDDDGNYQISNVPPGTYTINTWHETAGPVSGQLTVPEGGAVAWNPKIR